MRVREVRFGVSLLALDGALHISRSKEFACTYGAVSSPWTCRHACRRRGICGPESKHVHEFIRLGPFTAVVVEIGGSETPALAMTSSNSAISGIRVASLTSIAQFRLV